MVLSLNGHTVIRRRIAANLPWAFRVYWHVAFAWETLENADPGCTSSPLPPLPPPSPFLPSSSNVDRVNAAYTNAERSP